MYTQTKHQLVCAIKVVAFISVLSSSVFAEKVTQTGEKPSALRVCADPSNLPYSDKKGNGFENKIASIIAKDLNAKLEYHWVVQHRGFVRRTLALDECDVVMSVPTKFGPVSTTNPYFTSSYVVIMRVNDPRQFTSFDDAWLTEAKIGLQMVAVENATTPPAVALSRRGLNQHITAFSMWSEKGTDNPQGKIIEAVAKGEIDVAFVWGPFAGYFGKKYAKNLRMEPVTSDPKTPEHAFIFPMSIGVRKTDLVFRDRLQEALYRHADEINKILKEFRVPLISNDTQSEPIQQSELIQKNINQN